MGCRKWSHGRSREIPRIQAAVYSCAICVYAGVSRARSLRSRVVLSVGLGRPAIAWAVSLCGLASNFASLPLDASRYFADHLGRPIHQADRLTCLYSFVPSKGISWSYAPSHFLALHLGSGVIRLDLYAASRRMRLRPRARCRWIARLARHPLISDGFGGAETRAVLSSRNAGRDGLVR